MTDQIGYYVFMSVFLIYMAAVLTSMVAAMIFLAGAAGTGDRDLIPRHLRFNPLNVILYPSSLTEDGVKLRNKGLKCLRLFVTLVVVGLVVGKAFEFAMYLGKS
jgi:hypothetical protein